MQPRILVAEDDTGIRDIIRTRLHLAGYGVETVRTGIDALTRIDTWKPHALVLDINMPDLDGFGVLETLKQRGTRPPPTLVLTARHAGEDVKRAVGLGAKDYLTKPFTEGQLLARVARLLRPAAPRGPTVEI